MTTTELKSTLETHHPEPDYKAPELTPKEIIDRVMAPVGASSWKSNLVLAICFVVVVVAAVLFWRQTQVGMYVTGLNRPVFWGWYIVTFVFWIGVAHAGTLISAIVRLCETEWKSAITRIAEVITLFTLPAAAAFPLIHIGRNGVFFFLMPYPNYRHLWPDFRSPLMWDFFAISTYFIGSVIFVYVTLIPDLGITRTKVTGWLRPLYSILSWGWRGTQPEWKRMREATTLLSVLILPVVISVHTIVSWDFAMQLVPAWHETVFGPYFAAGAAYSGIASAVIVMAILKWTCPSFEGLIEKSHFDYMGRVFLVIALIWNYLFFNDFIPHYYAHDPDVMNWFNDMAFGHFAIAFWIMFITNSILPILLLGFKEFRKSIFPMFLLGCGVNLGMFLERVIIVVGGEQIYNDLVRNPPTYFPSITELTVIAGSFCAVIAGLILFARTFPILPIWELIETKAKQKVQHVAGGKLYYFRGG
jgi:Ni/Fe-hydrogenase subunit HybB-like protein